MDYYTIRAQGALLDASARGRTIEAVRILDRALFIRLSGDIGLKLGCVPDMPYIVPVDAAFIPIKKSHDWHAARLVGRTLIGVAADPYDRILTLALGSGVRCIFEMTGRHANIVLVDKADIIFGAFRTITARESGFREIRPGIAYTPPPSRRFLDSASTAAEEALAAIRSRSGTLGEAVAAVFCRGSRSFTGEVFTRSGLNPDAPSSDCSRDDITRLLAVITELDSIVMAGGDGATILRAKDGLPRDVLPLKITAEATNADYFEDIHEAVRVYAREREIGLEQASLKNAVLSSLLREEKSLAVTLIKVRRELGDDGEPDRLEREANTILAYMHQIPRGASEVTLPDPYGGGDTTLILEPSLDSAANADRLFTRSRKLRAARSLAEDRIASINGRLESLHAERERVEPLVDLRELKALAAARARMGPRERDDEVERPFPRRFMSPSGLDIIVGRNDRENDDLVKWARKDDYWLHAQGVGGSHVILRAPGKQQHPDRASIEYAASIAALYSKAKTSAVVPVVCTPVKYVVKRKGQGPGQVTYTHEKVVFTAPATIVHHPG